MGLAADVWWQGYGGLILKRTERKLRTLLKIRDPPKYLLLHVGGNDLGHTRIKDLKGEMIVLADFINKNMPKTTLIWSGILPRNWDTANKGLEAARKRINTLGAKISKGTGGFYIKHTNLIPFDFANYQSDGVHLTEDGEQKFIMNIQFALSQILQGKSNWYK